MSGSNPIKTIRHPRAYSTFEESVRRFHDRQREYDMDTGECVKFTVSAFGQFSRARKLARLARWYNMYTMSVAEAKATLKFARYRVAKFVLRLLRKAEVVADRDYRWDPSRTLLARVWCFEQRGPRFLAIKGRGFSALNRSHRIAIHLSLVHTQAPVLPRFETSAPRPVGGESWEAFNRRKDREWAYRHFVWQLRLKKDVPRPLDRLNGWGASHGKNSKNAMGLFFRRGAGGAEEPGVAAMRAMLPV